MPPKVHFCNQKSEKALVVESTLSDNKIVADIPNILLQEPYRITAYVYLETDIENSSWKTIQTIEIPVRKRPKPDDYEYVENVKVVYLSEIIKIVEALNQDVRDAESAREENESVRISNENIRTSNEIARENAESTREESESSRVVKENERISNESTRTDNENARVSNENIRKTNEENRQNEESVRKLNESSRASEENKRVSAENTRIENENIRISNENERVNNENTRIQQEAQRQQKVEQTIKDIAELKGDLGELDNFVFQVNEKTINLIFESALIEFDTGVKTASSRNISTKERIPDNIDIVTVRDNDLNNWYICLYAFDSDGNYVGCYNGIDYDNHRHDMKSVDLRKVPNDSYSFYISAHKDGYPTIDHTYGVYVLFKEVEKVEKYAKNECVEVLESKFEDIKLIDNSVSVRVADFDDGILNDDDIITNALTFVNTFKHSSLIFDTRNWNVSRAILIPSNTTIIIDGVTVKQNDGVFDNIFRTDNIEVDSENPRKFPLSISECENIRLIGINGGKIIGCDNPKISDYSNKPNVPMTGDAWGWRAITALFVLCNGVEVSGLEFEQSHMWSISFEKCQNGYVHDLKFNTSELNADGVDLRAGCKNFKIENISGKTYDDAVALSNNSVKGNNNSTYPIDNSAIYPTEVSRYLNTGMSDEDLTIENIQVKNVKTGGNCRVAICYSSNNGNIKNVLFDSISDSGVKENDNQIAIFKIYDGGGYLDNNIRNIRVNDIKSNNVYHPIQILNKVDDVRINKVNKSSWMVNKVTYDDGVYITNVSSI